MTPIKFITNYSALLAKHGSQRAVALAIGIPRTTIQAWLANEAGIRYSQQEPAKAIKVAVPRRDTKRFIFTSAQDETDVHEPFLQNLKAYAEHLGARLIIAGFTYNKRLYEENRKERASYHPSVEPFLQNRRMEVGPNLSFCGEMNTLPSATSPLSGFETYTKERWGIFPHAKVQLVSVPTMQRHLGKQIMTTGAVTKPNYVQRRAGILAQFHHVYGAVIVEIDRDGDQFCRHLLGDEHDGSFQDLTKIVDDGKVTDGHRIEAINWGDSHFEMMDEQVAQASFGYHHSSLDTMLDWLRPKYQFFHDIVDFTYRNHHNIKDPHFRQEMMQNGTEDVEEAIKGTAEYLRRALRPWCKSIVVESNHDRALLRWLKETDWRDDPINAIFHLKANTICLEAIRDFEPNWSVFEWAMRRAGPDISDAIFLRESTDPGFQICNGQIECSMHGHLGANGARPSAKQFVKAGPKSNTGHRHSPGITDGNCCAGTSSKLDMRYNKGLSSWAHAHIGTYPNAKRTIITMQNGKFCAQ